MLRRHANGNRVKATRRKVVSRRYANRSRVKATRRKVIQSQSANRSRVKLLANRKHCTYVMEITLKQHAKLSRLEKPVNGNRTSGACKETGQRRWKERKLLENGPRNWTKDINSNGQDSRYQSVRCLSSFTRPCSSPPQRTLP